ncbi:MAG: hypothetical protein QG639_658 [Patescibacteria group bacterium]|nr:hypothetical protein [Patescibacteria group bacterium]
MVVDFLRVLVWLLLTTLVAIVEYSTGLPILTVCLLLVAVKEFSTVWFIFFVTVSTAVLSALFLESWTLIWLIVMIGALLFRMPSHKSRKTFLTRVSVVVIAALLVSVMREPTVTLSFFIHSVISLLTAIYILWRKLVPKHQGFDIADLRFRADK